MTLPVSTLMERRVCAVRMDDTVAQVDALFLEHGLHWAPVLDAGHAALGVISAADLLQFHAQGRDPAAVRAWQLCTYKPIGVDEATPLSEVARLMVERRIHHVIVNGDAGVVGVVSSLDFVRTFIADRPAAAGPAA